MTSGTAIGSSSKVLLRGASSITGDNQPLFVVDGVPMDNADYSSGNQQRSVGGYDYGNAIQDLNPDDIESVSVLKGPAAAAFMVPAPRTAPSSSRPSPAKATRPAASAASASA